MNLMAEAVREVLRSAKEQARYTGRRRRWDAAPRYSLLMGRGTVLNADGSVAYREPEWMPNALTNTGQADMLNVYLKASSQTATFYLRAATATTGASAPSKTNTSSDIVTSGASSTQIQESAGGGYSAQSIANAAWGTPGLSSGDEASTAAQKTFGPASSADWTGTSGTTAGLKYMLLSTASSGTSGILILYIALAGVTTVLVTQSFAYTLSFKQT